MADAVDTGNRVFVIGNVFSRAFGVMKEAAPVVFGVSLLFGAIPQAIWSFFMPSLLVGLRPGDSSAIVAVAIIAGLVTLVLNLIVQAALVRVVIAHGEGRGISIPQAISTGISIILPLLGLAILAWLGIMVGMILLVVPGIIVLLMWCVAGPALVDERAGIIASLGRSRYLTKGARWKIFGLFAVLIVVMWIFLFVIGLLSLAGSMDATAQAMAGQAPSMVSVLIGLIFNTLLMGFWATMLTSLFVELRNWKDGLAPDNLAEVFS